MGLIDQMNTIIWMKVKTRFMKRVEQQENQCWLWIGVTNGTYGTFHVLGANKTVYAHRLAYELFKEPIKDGNVVMHTCDNPLCVNPEHLRQGTQQENMLDKEAKGHSFYPGMRRPLFGIQNSAAKVNPEIVQLIRNSYQVENLSYGQLAKKYSISKSQVYRIVKGDHWTKS